MFQNQPQRPLTNWPFLLFLKFSEPKIKKAPRPFATRRFQLYPPRQLAEWNRDERRRSKRILAGKSKVLIPVFTILFVALYWIFAVSYYYYKAQMSIESGPCKKNRGIHRYKLNKFLIEIVVCTLYNLYAEDYLAGSQTC